MTEKEAYRILGLPAGSRPEEIKKRYRQLMMQAHPDAGARADDSCAYRAHEINSAYSVLKKKETADAEETAGGHPADAGVRPARSAWNAPVNPHAYAEREILQYAEDAGGEILGNFCVARGKYMWTVEEDFPLFLLSVFRCGGRLLDDADASLPAGRAPALRQQIHAELTYLLAQQFIAGTEMLEALAKEVRRGPDGVRVFYLPAMLESRDAITLQAGEPLYPLEVRQHRLYLKTGSGAEAGYLSFADDRLYYVVIPLFEQKTVQVRIQAAQKQPAGRDAKYRRLRLWIRAAATAATRMPENLNLQIRQLLQGRR